MLRDRTINQKAKGGGSMGMIPTTLHVSGETTGGVITVKGKILEFTIEDDQPAHPAYAYCACGSGGGCSSGRYVPMPM